MVDALHIPFDATNWHGDYRTPNDERNGWRAFLRTVSLDPLESGDAASAMGIGLTTPRMR